MRRFGSANGRSQLLQAGRRGGGRAFYLASRSRLAVSCLAGGLLPPLARVERPRQSETVVARRDGAMRLLQRRGRGGELRSGVPFSARGTRGVDCALSAIDLFLGRFGAGGGNDERAQQGGQSAHQPEV